LSLPRDEIKKQIRHAGGTVVGSVSKKTDYVLAGNDPGSKVETAKALGVTIISEAQLAKLLS
jgi:DNA ligase (NAD+)